MLARMNRVPARPGQSILVPAGTVHAIDAGVFVLEIQEPTDFSILLEWSATSVPRDQAHLDLGWETAMKAVSSRALSTTALTTLIRQPSASPLGVPTSALPRAADPYFILRQVTVSHGTSDAIPGAFAVLFVTEGDGYIVRGADRLSLQRGDSVAVPSAWDGWRVEGAISLLMASAGLGNDKPY
jgi:mannose-6-phosphate isomerase